MKVRMFRNIVLAVGVSVVCGALAIMLFLPQIETLYENAAYALFPSPERALAYGNRHFDASNPGTYDINRAYYFYELAAVKDPSLPYLYHQIARISFLRGNFEMALAQINLQINLHGDNEPKAYYVRALIEGFMGDYDSSIRDYQHFLQFDPHDWAGINDYAWVLLKANRPQEAVDSTMQALAYFPDNAWLLNTNAIALYEIGDLKDAKTQAVAALAASKSVTQAQWLHAYPGNDPKVAAQGIAAFQSAARENTDTILAATSSISARLVK